MQLLLETNGLKLSVAKKRFLVEGKNERRYISPKLVDSIAIHANILLTSAVVELAISSEIPVLFFDRIGNPLGRTWSLRFKSHPLIRRNQVFFEADAKRSLEWVVSLYSIKAAGQAGNLKKLKSRHPTALAELAAFPEKLKTLEKLPGKNMEAVIMGIEGAAARAYWEAISMALPAGYRFDGRSRRPAQDFFNCALNYTYGMLYNVVEGALFSAGLDPYLGIVHADEYNRPALAFDMIEPFRPWFDALVAEAFINDRLQPDHFSPLTKGGWTLNRSGKKVLIPLFMEYLNSKMRWQGKRLSRKNHIYQFAGEFAAMLKGLDYS